MERGGVSNFIILGVLVLHLMLLPLVVFWVIMKRSIYRVDFIKGTEASVESYRFTNKISSISAYSSRKLESSLDKKLPIQYIGIFRRNIASKHFVIKLEDDNKKSHLFIINKKGAGSRVASLINTQYEKTKIEGGNNSIVLTDKTNKLKLKLHNDLGVRVLAEFNGNNAFLKNVKSEMLQKAKA